MIDTTNRLFRRPDWCLTNPSLLLHILYGPKIYIAESINDFLKDKKKVKTTKNITGFLLPEFLLGPTWNNHYTVHFVCPVQYRAIDGQKGTISDLTASLEVKLWYDEANSFPASATNHENIVALVDNMRFFDCAIGYRKKDGYTWLITYDASGSVAPKRTNHLVELIKATA